MIVLKDNSNSNSNMTSHSSPDDLTPPDDFASSHDSDSDSGSLLEREDYEHNFELQVLPDPRTDQRSIEAFTDEEDNFDDEGRISGDGAEHEYRNSLTSEPRRTFTPDEERRLVRILDRRLVLFMAFLYLLSFLDRSNIGNAKIAGLSEDLGLSDSQWQWLLEGFYLTYTLFEWMILLYNVVRPHVYISLCILSWGLIASFQSAATSFSQMLILRLLLGISEAAFSPGVPFYLSFFYRREELAFRTGIMISAAPLATSFAGSLAWLITWLGQNGPFAPWRLLFLVEGFPSVIVAAFAWSYIPDSPETSKFLSSRQRKIAKRRLLTTNPSSSIHAKSDEEMAGAPKVKSMDWREVARTLRDPKCYLTALMFFNCNVAFSSLPVFLPTIIKEMGYSTLSSQALSAPPYLLSFIIVLYTAYISDSQRARSPYIALHAFIGSLGYFFIAIGGAYNWPNLVRYFFVYPAATGFFSCITLIIAWTLNNQESASGRGTGMTVLNFIGQCGPFLGTRLYPESDKPYYIMGMSVCAAVMFLVLVLALVLRGVLMKENRARRTAAVKSIAANGDGDEPFLFML